MRQLSFVLLISIDHPTHCAALCYNYKYITGTASQFYIQLRDQYANPLLIGGQADNTVRVFLVIETQAIHIPTNMTDLENGQYIVHFEPTIKGSYVPIVLVAGQEVDSSEIALLNVEPSDISARYSELITPVSGVTYDIGQPLYIIVTARDIYGMGTTQSNILIINHHATTLSAPACLCCALTIFCVSQVTIVTPASAIGR